jgi:serine/threonine protein kinase
VSRAAAEVGSTANSYQILAKLATGGMAEIFLARGEGVAGVERYCVLKRILRDRASDVHFVRMFLDEARLAAQLQHPNIAQVYDIGKLGDSYFFTMEYVHGETVRALLHRAQGLRRHLPINCVLTIAAGTAAGLHHAHARLGFDGRALGIVHRDVSPSNLMVSYEGGVKVVDFGVAKAADRAQETKSGTVKGKISYLSPEQCKGKRVDRRSDLFSLGICFWEMLTTERLYRRASDFENMNAIVSEDTPPPSSRRPDVPPEVDELVLRLLAKEPEQRFQTADEVVDAIEGVAARTASVLSASALGRFVRELFGQRPEPWLELEGQQEHGEAVTVTSEPIPRELAVPVADEVNQQLASVLDLSPPRSITESLESLPVDVPTAQLGKRGLAGLPLAPPPPTHPGLARTAPDPDTASPLPPPPLRMPPPHAIAEASAPSGDLHTQSLSSMTPQGPAAYLPTPGAIAGARSGAMAAPDASSAAAGAVAGLAVATVAQSGPLAVAPSGPLPSSGLRPGSLPVGSSGSLAVVPSGPLPSSGLRSGPMPVGTSGPLAVAPGAVAHAPSGLRSPSIGPPGGPLVAPAVSSSGTFASSAPSGSQDAVRLSAMHTAPFRRRRVPWRLYAVIGGAALVGSVAMILVMRSGSGDSLIDAAGAVRAADVTGTAAAPASTITVSPITVVPIEPAEPDAISAPDRRAAALPGAVVGAAESGSPGVIVPDHLGHAAAPGRADEPPGRPPGGPRRLVSPSVAPGAGSARSDAVKSVSPAQAAEAAEERARAYAAGRYDDVVDMCAAGPVSAEHAPLCFLAACHAGNEAKARKLIGAVPAGRRDQLTTNCKQLGVDITAHKKTDKPSEDCEADPMACQH